MKKFRPSESKREKRSRHKRKLVALAFYLSAFITAGIIGCSTKNENPNGKALVLVHGLGDSPYSFRDIANHLAEQDYLVRAILLPSHGSLPF
jgi:alpha-beta hydrolase superfamily lysophospholipase